MGLQEHLLYGGTFSALHTLLSLYSSASSISLPFCAAASAGTFFIDITAIGRKEQNEFRRLKQRTQWNGRMPSLHGNNILASRTNRHTAQVCRNRTGFQNDPERPVWFFLCTAKSLQHTHYLPPYDGSPKHLQAYRHEESKRKDGNRQWNTAKPLWAASASS